jgi:hypothetical protein
MAAPLLTFRCWNHGERLAVARCSSCGRHYCRECVAEHDGRMVCGACLRREQPSAGVRGRAWLALLGGCAQTLAALFVAWLVFYGAGRLLLRIPDSLHEGAFWSNAWRDDDKP